MIRTCATLAATLAIGNLLANETVANNDKETRRISPLVQAVSAIRPSVVNIRGQKVVRETPIAGSTVQHTKQVNGMGTGVVLDSRGYILTNFHVVENINRIEVTLHDGTTTTGKLVAVDDDSDLAIVKINSPQTLPVVPMGTSSDLMLAESVAAIGNAYGYEHTVTRGIISELGRTVQVSDEQVYYNLIQTDAAINPGNSGGPLLNMDGDMIGVNVAVRVGAQGIAFAIPVNDAIDIAADMFEDIVDDSLNLGFTTRTVYRNDQPILKIETVDPESPASRAGLRPGDQIQSVNSAQCSRRIDLYRELIDRKLGDTIAVQLTGNSTKQIMIPLAGNASLGGQDLAWQHLGIRVTETRLSGLPEVHADYKNGLRVDEVRVNSPATQKGIQAGDVIVAMDGWKTESLDNIAFVLQQSKVLEGENFEFFIFRGNESLYGQIRVARRE